MRTAWNPNSQSAAWAHILISPQHHPCGLHMYARVREWARVQSATSMKNAQPPFLRYTRHFVVVAEGGASCPGRGILCQAVWRCLTPDVQAENPVSHGGYFKVFELAGERPLGVHFRIFFHMVQIMLEGLPKFWVRFGLTGRPKAGLPQMAKHFATWHLRCGSDYPGFLNVHGKVVSDCQFSALLSVVT